MTDQDFWELVSLLDWDKTGDDDAVIEPVVVELSERDEETIFGFEDILTKILFDLGTMAHVKEIGEAAYVSNDNYFSVDGFLYARTQAVRRHRTPVT